MPADKLHITLAGREHVVEAGTTAGQALASSAAVHDVSQEDSRLDGAGRGKKAGGEVIAARVNGTARDLAWEVADGDVVEAIEAGSPDG